MQASAATAAPGIQVTVENTEGSGRRLSVTVSADRVRRIRSQIAQRLAGQASLPGFRRGKVTPKLVEQRFAGAVEQETIDQAIQDAYREAVQSQGLEPITEGRVENIQYERDADLRFEAVLEVRPEIELARLGGFRVTRPTYSVGDQEVDAVLARVRDEQGVLAPLAEGERPVLGDQVTVELAQRDADAEGEAAEPRPYRFALGEGQAIPDVERAIASLRPGEQTEQTVRYPDDFADANLAGKEQRLQISLVDAHRKELPTLDDEFARGFGDFETMEALRARIRADLEQDAERRAEAEARNALADQIIEANPFEVPRSMADRYLERLVPVPRERDGKPRELTPAQREQVAEWQEQLRPQAEAALRRMMIVERVAEAENLRATAEDVDRRVEELAEQHGRSPGEVWSQLQKSGQLEQLESELTEDRVWEHLKSVNTVA